MKNKAGVVITFLLLTTFAVLASCKQQKADWQETIVRIDRTIFGKTQKEAIQEGQSIEPVQDLEATNYLKNTIGQLTSK